MGIQLSIKRLKAQLENKKMGVSSKKSRSQGGIFTLK